MRGRLTPEVGALLRRALEAGREALYPRRPAPAAPGEPPAQDARGEPGGGPPAPPAEPRPTQLQQNADALALLAETALHHALDPGAPGERDQVEEGNRVSAETSRRLACDASRVVMWHDADGRVVEVGARTRTIPPAMRRALHYRDRGCRFPGCGVRVTQGHHLRHWAQGGPTTLSNLASLCGRHHRAMHEEGYTVERRGDDLLVFRRPDGRELPHVPEPAAMSADPAATLRATHTTLGLEIDARTSRPTWLGERLNLGYALDVLHPAAGTGSATRFHGNATAAPFESAPPTESAPPA